MSPPAGEPGSGIGALYHDAIKAAARRATGEGRLEAPDVEATVDNPLCGDRVTMGAMLDGGARLARVGHRVRGCLLCEAAAALIAESCAGADRGEIERVLAALSDMLAGGETDLGARWEALRMFEPVAAFRSRHRCVTLPFEALREALAQSGGSAPAQGADSAGR